MNADKMMDALNDVKEEYIMDAAPEKKKKTKSRGWIAAAVVLVAGIGFLQTPPGVNAREYVTNTVTGAFESLFPPRRGAVSVEGQTEIKHQEAAVQEPETESDGAALTPGFAMYYDTETYTLVEEGEVTYIRFVTDAEIPPCEVEICHIPGSGPEEGAASAREEMAAEYETVSEAEPLEGLDGVSFSYYAGLNWDSPCGCVYFISDGQGGSFRLISRYFVEAAEGHGSRFAQMIQSFQVLAP